MPGDENTGDDAEGEGLGAPDEDEPLAGVKDIELTPEEHQKIKDLVNGDRLTQVKNHERRYLICGAGGETGAAERRMMVYDRLDSRSSPSAMATRLEDFDLGTEEIRLWARVFDILCGEATHIVAVIEDFDGGYVWEMGLLFASEYREKGWILKRRYDTEEKERERYENGMAASHVELLLTGDWCHEWTDRDELERAIEKVP